MKKKVICIIVYTFRELQNLNHEFLKTHDDLIKGKYNGGEYVYESINEEYHLMTAYYYQQWCKGRTYYLNGDEKLYRSGFQISTKVTN